MKLKYNHDGQTLSIPLTDTKPAGKSFAVRHNGTTFYAPTVPVNDPFATDCTVVIGGQPCALSRGIAPNSVTLGGASAYEVTAEDRQRGVTVTDFSNAVNITGLTFADIKFCSYISNTIELELAGRAKVILPNAATNALVLDGSTVYVGDNVVFNNTDSLAATNFSVTTYGHTVVDKSAATNALVLDGSYNKTSVTLIGGNKNDTLKSGTGNSTLTGGAGADVFVHTGGTDVITDYTMTDKDKVSLASGTLGDLSGVKVDSSGATLEFGDNDSIVLNGIDTASTVTFAAGKDTYGSGYVFDNDSVRTAASYGVTLTGEGATYSIAGKVTNTLIANNGGTLEGGTRAATLGGAGEISIKGGTGKETFVYKGGGNMNIANFTSSDRISLASGYTVTYQLRKLLTTVGSGDDTQENVVLPVSGGNATQTITIENSTALNSVNVNTNGVDKSINLPHGEITFNNSDPAGATQVVLHTNKLTDFGVFSKTEATPSTAPGSEYYTAIVYITAFSDNASIIGNFNKNYVTLTGGSDNYFVGGIGASDIFFDKGGGLIADFGISATTLQLNGRNKALATTTKRTGTSTFVAYNRTNTGSYARGLDTLTLNGTVNAIYYDTVSGDNSASINTFDAALVYTDTNGKDEVILLPDIAKQRTNTATSSLHAASFNRTVIYDNAHETSLTAADKATLVQDWADFPASLQTQTIKLYNMYNTGNFKNGYASLSPVPQVLPDWIPAKEWLS